MYNVFLRSYEIQFVFAGDQQGEVTADVTGFDKGTLFLDEIGDLPLESQGKLLRALQEKRFQRVGGNEEIPVDVRVICATNKNLEQMVLQGKFRQDLFYRINVFPIGIPPLRQRKEDIVPLAGQCKRAC